MITKLNPQSCTDRTFNSPFCTKICTSPGTHKNGFADVLECPDFDGRFYCGVGNASTCQTDHTIRLSSGFFADFRNTKSGSPPATVTVSNTEGTCTETGVSAGPTATIGFNGTTVLQSLTSSSPTASATVVAFNSTSRGERVAAASLGKAVALFFSGGLLFL